MDPHLLGWGVRVGSFALETSFRETSSSPSSPSSSSKVSEEEKKKQEKELAEDEHRRPSSNAQPNWFDPGREGREGREKGREESEIHVG